MAEASLKEGHSAQIRSPKKTKIFTWLSLGTFVHHHVFGNIYYTEET